jgi:hypothetical protein
MAPPIERVLQLGFRFEPKPVDAVTYYLPRLIAGVPMHATVRSFIHSTDIYAWEPAVLAAHYRPTPKAGDRFFFTTFKRQPGNSGKGVRSAGPGHWHTQGHTKDVLNDAGVKVGEVKKFRYMKAKKFTGWLMDEFSSCAADTVVGDRQYVLCKMYMSPRVRPDSAALQESAAFVAFAPPPPPAPEGQELVAATIPTPPPVVPRPSPLPVQAPAPCSLVAAPETEPPTAAQDDGLGFIFDIDLDFAMSDEGNSWIKETEEEALPRAVPIPTPPLMEPPSPLHEQAPAPHPHYRSQHVTAAPAVCSPVAAPTPAPEEDHVAAPNKRPAPPIAKPPRPTKRIRAAAKIPTPPSVEEPPLPSPVQASAPPAPRLPVCTRDPFCMEESSAAAAREHGGAVFDGAAFYEQAEEAPDQAQDGDDYDFVKSLEGSLVVLETEKQAEDEASTEEADDEMDEEAPAQAQDDDDCDFEFVKSLEGSLIVLETEKQAEDEASTEEADDETGWFPSLKPAKEQACRKSDHPFDPTSGRKRKPL